MNHNSVYKIPAEPSSNKLPDNFLRRVILDNVLVRNEKSNINLSVFKFQKLTQIVVCGVHIIVDSPTPSGCMGCIFKKSPCINSIGIELGVIEYGFCSIGSSSFVVKS